MVVAYRVDAVAARLRFLLKVDSVVLANLVLGENAFPEFIQEDCTSARLSAALAPLLTDTPERAAQLRALAGIRRQDVPAGRNAEGKAADIVLAILVRPPGSPDPFAAGVDGTSRGQGVLATYRI